ncbi:MAG: hypothetical protein LUC92_06695 [Clostridiales bacterium]|nr:hypothetical protein [Clostridiales bacterium]
MKKIFVAVLIIVLGLNFISVYADDGESSADSGVNAEAAGETEETSREEQGEIINYVTRLDCVSEIMKAAGLQADGYFSSEYITMEKMFEDDPFYDREYAYFAKRTGVLIGEENEASPTWVNCRPNETVTIKECTGFIMRTIDPEAQGKTDDELFESAKLRGLVKVDDSFYSDPDKALSYNDYYTLICRMLKEKRYLYFIFNDNLEPFDWRRDFLWNKAEQYDELGEMTYFEYLKSCCGIDENTPETAAVNQIIKKLNITRISQLNCLMAVTKIGGMRVEGLFEGDDVFLSVMEAAGLNKKGMELAKTFGYRVWNMPDYSAETSVFSVVYGILPDDEPEDEKSYFDYNKKVNLFCTKASVKDCVSYIMWFLTDMPQDITSEEIYNLALQVGLVQVGDSIYEDWEEPIDYVTFKTLLNRMLSMKRYNYFEEENSESLFEAERCDKKGEVTYLDFFKEICGLEEAPEL